MPSKARPRARAACLLACLLACLAALPEAGRADSAGTANTPAWDPTHIISTALDAMAVAPPGAFRDWSDAPPPQEARCYAVAPDRSESVLQATASVLLAIPRAGWQIAEGPVRGSLSVLGRYRPDLLFWEIFFNEERTFGIYPTFFVETEFGLNVGARLVHRDLFGEGESLGMRAGFGGRHDQIYQISLGSGRRFGDRLRLGLRARYEADPKERFFGIGNEDETEPPQFGNVNALARDTAVSTRYGLDTLGGRGVARLRLAGDLYTRLTSLAKVYDSTEADSLGGDVQLESVFNTGTVVGFETDIEDLYNEVSLEWDTRSTPNPFLSRAIDSRGVLLRAYGGYHVPFAGDAYDGFFRYGGQAQTYFDLFGAGRVVRLRAIAEEVTGDLDEIPFVLLPTLGGKRHLRGYETDRFRDRALTLATAEYMWPLNEKLSAILFGDVGRVQESLEDTELDNMRFGYGFALQLHTMDTFLASAQIASSIDGDLFASVVFSPVLDDRVYRPQP